MFEDIFQIRIIEFSDLLVDVVLLNEQAGAENGPLKGYQVVVLLVDSGSFLSSRTPHALFICPHSREVYDGCKYRILYRSSIA